MESTSSWQPLLSFEEKVRKLKIKKVDKAKKNVQAVSGSIKGIQAVH